MIGTIESPGASILEAAEFDSECHLYDWFRVAEFLRHARAGSVYTGDIDWAEIERSRTWSGPLVVELRFPERTSGGVTIHSVDRSRSILRGADKSGHIAGPRETGAPAGAASSTTAS